MPNKARYRSKIRIMVDILRVVQKEGETRVTKILYGANLSHDRLNKYLGELMSRGLVTSFDQEGLTFYSLTDKGKRFLFEFRKFERFAEAFGLEI